MAPKKQEQTKEVVKLSQEPEATKEPDFDAHNIKVSLSVWLFDWLTVLSACLYLCLSNCMSVTVCLF